MEERTFEVHRSLQVSGGRCAGAAMEGEDTGAGLDVATAAAWAYEHGYLRLLLDGPPLCERLQQLADASDQPVSRCHQLLLLCPSDGRPPEQAEQLAGGRLVSVGRAATFSSSVAGARSRQYGGHPVFRLRRSRPPEEQRLVAVEAVGSLRTLCVVADAMAGCRRPLPPLDARRLVGQFIARLSNTLARDDAMREAFRLVEYDPSQEGAMEAALEAAAFGAASAEQRAVPTPSPALVPGGVGVYLAWSFLHGYLALTVGRRDLAAELERLRGDAALPLALARVVVLCPTSIDWSDDMSSLAGQLQPVRDVDGVELAGRSYGSFSIYCSRRQTGGSCFALELATPLRTLRLGMAGAGLGPQVYRREAVRFTEELQTLLAESPAVATHYAALRVDEGTDIVCELDKLAAHFRPEKTNSQETSQRSCALL